MNLILLFLKIPRRLMNGQSHFPADCIDETLMLGDYREYPISKE